MACSTPVLDMLKDPGRADLPPASVEVRDQIAKMHIDPQRYLDMLLDCDTPECTHQRLDQRAARKSTSRTSKLSLRTKRRRDYKWTVCAKANSSRRALY